MEQHAATHGTEPRSMGRWRRLALVGALLALAAAATVGVVRAGWSDRDEPGEGESGRWARLPDAPLSPRTGASVAWTGSEVVVIGGWDFLCPPNADCALPERPSFRDGAAFDPATMTWRAIAPAPIHLPGLIAAVVEGDLFLLVPGPDVSTLLQYDPVADTWKQHLGLPHGDRYRLAAAGSLLIAYVSTDEHGDLPDWHFDPLTGSWAQIPRDPLPLLFDRSVVYDAERTSLLLFGALVGRVGGEPADERVLGVRFDLVTGTWSHLPVSPSRGYRAWSVDDVVALEPHFGGSGGVFDPEKNVWSATPPVPDGFDHNSVAGVLGVNDAVYGDARGWVLDISSQRWLELPELDSHRVHSFSSVAAAGRDLFVFGGERWDGAQGELLGDAWLWRAPIAEG